MPASLGRRSPLGVHTRDVFEVIAVAGQVLVLEVIADGIEALLAPRLRLVGALPGDSVSFQATAHRLAHLIARQAGPHGPEEEFVVAKDSHRMVVLNV
jgi:hypothetical protein